MAPLLFLQLSNLEECCLFAFCPPCLLFDCGHPWPVVCSVSLLLQFEFLDFFSCLIFLCLLHFKMFSRLLVCVVYQMCAWMCMVEYMDAGMHTINYHTYLIVSLCVYVLSEPYLVLNVNCCVSGDLYRIVTPVFGVNSILFLNGAEGRARRQLFDYSLQHENLDLYSGQLHKVGCTLC